MSGQRSSSILSRDHKSTAVLCLRARSDAQAAVQARARLSDPGFDWPGFLEYIRIEKVTPLIHDAVGSWGIVPPKIATLIQKHYIACLWMNTQRMEDLRSILAQMRAAGISVTLLKGAAMLCNLYDKRGLRPMTDVDLLVAPDDFETARKAMVICGYQQWTGSGVPEDALKEVGYHKLERQDLKIDLHLALFSGPHQLTEEQSAWFWKNRVRTVCEGEEAWIFNSTAQLLHLCTHLWFGHSNEGDNLLRMNDIDRLIRGFTDQIDWTELIRVGEAFEMLLPLQETLQELAEVWKSPVPVDVCTKLAKLSPTTRERRKFRKHWGDDQNYLKTLVGGTMSFPDWRSRFHYAKMIILPPRQYIMERYHVRSPIMVPYFYFQRLFSRLIQQVTRILQ